MLLSQWGVSYLPISIEHKRVKREGMATLSCHPSLILWRKSRLTFGILPGSDFLPVDLLEVFNRQLWVKSMEHEVVLPHGYGTCLPEYLQTAFPRHKVPIPI